MKIPIKIKDGFYNARTSGYKTVFACGGTVYTYESLNGVRGIDVEDKITVKSGVVRSKLIGLCTYHSSQPAANT